MTVHHQVPHSQNTLQNCQKGLQNRLNAQQFRAQDRWLLLLVLAGFGSDPSIFLVLQSPSDTPGVDGIDFVIFPPRILAMEHTFRPPWFHRNVMSEFMGLVRGEYDAKRGGFVPGAASLHNAMAAHGPALATFEKASAAELKPHKIEDALAFMSESRWVFRPTRAALQARELQKDYDSCWDGYRRHFKRK